MEKAESAKKSKILFSSEKYLMCCHKWHVTSGSDILNGVLSRTGDRLCSRCMCQRNSNEKAQSAIHHASLLCHN